MIMYTLTKYIKKILIFPFVNKIFLPVIINAQNKCFDIMKICILYYIYIYKF